MIYVGIDIAKFNHFAATISSDGKILIEPFKFTNDYNGFYLLLSSLAPLDQNSIIIGLELTAHYGNNLVRFLISGGLKVCVLNLIQTSAMLKNNVCKTKADNVDTFIIAKIPLMQDSLWFMTIPGIGIINGGMILSEIGDDIHPFLRTKETAYIRWTGFICSLVW